MKKIMTVLALALLTSTVQADFFGGNNGEWKMGPNGRYWDESDWPEWTPMYWMEEFMDSFDDDDDYGGYGGGYGGGYRGMPAMPYGNSGAPIMPGYPMAPYGGYAYPATPYGGGYGYPSAPVPPVQIAPTLPRP